MAIGTAPPGTSSALLSACCSFDPFVKLVVPLLVRKLCMSIILGVRLGLPFSSDNPASLDDIEDANPRSCPRLLPGERCACAFGLWLGAADPDAVPQRTQFHGWISLAQTSGHWHSQAASDKRLFPTWSVDSQIQRKKICR